MHYHNYIFLKTKNTFSEISQTKLNSFQHDFIQEIEKEKQVITYSYTTSGLKQNTTIMLWLQSDSILTNQDLLNKLMHTSLGKYLEITYTFFGMTRPTQYSPGSQKHEDTLRKGGQFLIIYPFTKTQAWYMLDFQKRKELMHGHISIGRKFPQIAQLLLYSYGIDDQEFIVSYEADNLSEFQQLIIELRSDPVRNYTQKDTPIFTCIYREIQETLAFL